MKSAHRQKIWAAAFCASAFLFGQAAGLEAQTMTGKMDNKTGPKALSADGVEDDPSVVDTAYVKVIVDHLGLANDGSQEIDMSGSLIVKETGVVLDYNAGGTIQSDGKGGIRISDQDHFVRIKYMEDGVNTEVTMTTLNNVLIQTIVLSSPEDGASAQINVIDRQTKKMDKFECAKFDPLSKEMSGCAYRRHKLDASNQNGASVSLRDKSVLDRAAVYAQAIFGSAMPRQLTSDLLAVATHGERSVPNSALVHANRAQQIDAFVKRGIPLSLSGNKVLLGSSKAHTSALQCH